jgi:exodeoxyribonuclease V alpha subunit
MQEGKVLRIIYSNKENGYVVATIETNAGEQKVSGYLYGLNTGDVILFEGTPDVHKKYGEQLKITRWEKPMPSTVQGIIEFLSSGLIKNVGPARAKMIANTLGPDALSLIRSSGPEIVRTIPGIGKRAEEIYNSIMENTALQATIQELSPLGIHTKALVKAYKRFGPRTAQTIKENPYRLIEIAGIGFHTADTIAINYGVKRNSWYRIQAALTHSLDEAMKSGHCCLPENELLKQATSLINHNPPPKEAVPNTEIENAYKAMLKSGDLIASGNIYTPRCYHAEIKLGEKISCLSYGSATPNIDLAIRSYEKKSGMILAVEQKDAIRSLYKHNLLILTGGPGTGKTETVRAITAIYTSLHPKAEISLASPTGRASRKLSEVTGMDASTIHRLLGIQIGGEPVFNEDNPLPCDLLVIDEASMLDLFLAWQLFQAVSEDTKVLLVGDKDQLPSVGPGNVLNDMLSAGVPSVYLSKIFRQAEQSQIVVNSHNVNNGSRVEIDPSKEDFYHIKTSDFPRAAELVKKSVLRLIQKGYSLDEVQVLSPMHKGSTGIGELNKLLQEALKTPRAKEYKHGDRLFRENDKVIQTRNNYEKDVFNGDVGVVTKIGPAYDDGEVVEKNALYVRYNGKTVVYLPSELDQIDLAYAITIHKSQWSEYRAVILVLTTQHYVFCLIGCDKALNIAINNNAVSKRNTGLAAAIKPRKESPGADVGIEPGTIRFGQSV